MGFKSCTMIDNLHLNINGRIDTGEKIISLCCEVIPKKPSIAFADTPEETLERFLGMRAMVAAESAKGVCGGRYTSGCERCANYQQVENRDLNMLISYVNLSMYPAPCQCRCIYCGIEKQWHNTPEVEAAYEKMFAMLELGKKSGIILPNAIWQVSSGEITIHPYRERIMELVRGQCAVFYTNAFRFEEDIGQNLHDNPDSAINLSIDAGTPGTWKKVKGFDNFEEVTSNLVRYYKQSVRPGQITLKYIILPGVNDTYEDYLSLMEIMKVLEVKHLSISRDVNNKYRLFGQERTNLLGAAAYLLAICHKNGIKCDMFAYSSEEKIEVLQLASEVLQAGQI